MDTDVMRVIAGWIAFAVFHSLTVSEGYERLARRAMGDRAFAAYHRLIFTAYSCAAFAVLVLYLKSVPDAPLIRIEGWPRLLFHAVQAGAAGARAPLPDSGSLPGVTSLCARGGAR